MRFRNFYILTLTLNVLCTCEYAAHRTYTEPHPTLAMISWKIWSVHRKVKRHAVAGVRVYGIMTIIIESGEFTVLGNRYLVGANDKDVAAVYSGLLAGLIVTTVLDSTVLWIIIDSVSFFTLH